jgi:hypothetical protein
MFRASAFIFLSSILLSNQPGLDKKMGEKKMRLFTPEHSSRDRFRKPRAHVNDLAREPTKRIGKADSAEPQFFAA